MVRLPFKLTCALCCPWRKPRTFSVCDAIQLDLEYLSLWSGSCEVGRCATGHDVAGAAFRHVRQGKRSATDGRRADSIHSDSHPFLCASKALYAMPYFEHSRRVEDPPVSGLIPGAVRNPPVRIYLRGSFIMTEYQPLAEVRQNLKVKWYRTKIDRRKMKATFRTE